MQKQKKTTLTESQNTKLKQKLTPIVEKIIAERSEAEFRTFLNGFIKQWKSTTTALDYTLVGIKQGKTDKSTLGAKQFLQEYFNRTSTPYYDDAIIQFVEYMVKP